MTYCRAAFRVALAAWAAHLAAATQSIVMNAFWARTAAAAAAAAAAVCCRMDGWMWDRRTDRRNDERTDGWTYGRTYGRTAPAVVTGAL